MILFLVGFLPLIIILRFYGDSGPYNCDDKICSAFDPLIEEDLNLIPYSKMLHPEANITPRQGAAYICALYTGEEVLSGIAISEPLKETDQNYIGELNDQVRRTLSEMMYLSKTYTYFRGECICRLSL